MGGHQGQTPAHQTASLLRAMYMEVSDPVWHSATDINSELSQSPRKRKHVYAVRALPNLVLASCWSVGQSRGTIWVYRGEHRSLTHKKNLFLLFLNKPNPPKLIPSKNGTLLAPLLTGAASALCRRQHASHKLKTGGCAPPHPMPEMAHRAPLMLRRRRTDRRNDFYGAGAGGRSRRTRCLSRENPCKPPPYRSVHDPFKTASGVQSSGPWDSGLPAVENSRPFAQRTVRPEWPNKISPVASFFPTMVTLVWRAGGSRGGGSYPPPFLHHSNASLTPPLPHTCMPPLYVAKEQMPLLSRCRAPPSRQ